MTTEKPNLIQSIQVFSNGGWSYEPSDMNERGFNANSLLISVIMPVYNEENSIKNVIERIPNHQNYEIILVNDGSTDNSLAKVKEINGKTITIITHSRNMGYGAALITGFKHATGDIIVTLDSDGQHDPEDIPKLIEPIIKEKADFVIGSRYLGNCNYKVPLSTRVGERFINSCLWLLFRKKVKNNQSGFRSFKRDLISIFDNLRFNGMGFTTEAIFKCAYENYNICEVPISLNPRKYGTSYVNLIRIVRSILSIISIYCLKKYKFFKN